MSIDRTQIRWNGWGWIDRPDPLAARDEVWRWLARAFAMPTLLATPPRTLEDITLPEPRLAGPSLASFTAILGADQVRQDKYERAFHALGRSYHDLLRLRAGEFAPPDAVLYPRNEDDVLAVLRLAVEREVAVVPYGGGTSVVGGVSASRGDFSSVVSLDLSMMDHVTEIDLVSGTASAEAGITGPELERELAVKGAILGHRPQSFEFSTLGGWIAHHGSGQEGGRYGRATDWLAGVRVATPQGIFTGNEAPASAAGPDMIRLMLGSEGVLGVVTQARVRIHNLPEREEYRGWLFRDFAAGIAAIREAVREGIPHTMLRLSDAAETQFADRFIAPSRQRDWRARLEQAWLDLHSFDDNVAGLIAGFAGSDREVSRARGRFGALARRLGALALGEAPGRRWREQRYLTPYLRDPLLDQGAGIDTLETAASWSKLPALYAAVRAALDAAMRCNAPREDAQGIVLCHISHAYADGASLYFTFLFPRKLDAEIEQWRAIKRAASDALLAAGGTISHHHGVGEDHLAWMEREKGAPGIAMLRAVKHALDPKGVLNPGKLIPR
ncbi:MAG TPA: FAD-binding oxidoreductase [Rhizomicrobium sp.]|nr:FAD-binding oxidoreductase [Rhizomicrobium sp.]